MSTASSASVMSLHRCQRTPLCLSLARMCGLTALRAVSGELRTYIFRSIATVWLINPNLATDFLVCDTFLYGSSVDQKSAPVFKRGGGRRPGLRVGGAVISQLEHCQCWQLQDVA